MLQSIILGEDDVFRGNLEWDDKFVKLHVEWPRAPPQNHNVKVGVHIMILLRICFEFIRKIFAVTNIYILGQKEKVQMKKKMHTS